MHCQHPAHATCAANAQAAMPTAPTLTRLAVALVSVANATAALSLPPVLARTCVAARPVAAAAQPHGGPLRLQRPPRVPRRERADHEYADGAAAGSAGPA
jgi:hypothetical protein